VIKLSISNVNFKQLSPSPFFKIGFMNFLNNDLFSAYECEYTRTHEHTNSKRSIYLSFGDSPCHNNYKLFRTLVRDYTLSKMYYVIYLFVVPLVTFFFLLKKWEHIYYERMPVKSVSMLKNKNITLNQCSCVA
jgi:hypothetical protein